MMTQQQSKNMSFAPFVYMMILCEEGFPALFRNSSQKRDCVPSVYDTVKMTMTACQNGKNMKAYRERRKEL